MAHQIGFREANDIVKPPEGMSPAECMSLEVFRNEKYCISRWQFTNEELEELKKNGGKAYLVFLSQTQPPVRIDVMTPFRPTVELVPIPIPVKNKRGKRKTD